MNIGIALFTLSFLFDVQLVVASRRGGERHHRTTTIASSPSTESSLTALHDVTEARVSRQKHHHNKRKTKSRDVSCDGQCDVQLCPMFNVTGSRSSCQPRSVGVVVSDPCQCCTCDSSTDVVTTTDPVPVPVPRSPASANACDQLTCPRNKVCLLNIQGLPMCRCLSHYHCKGVEKRPVCTDENRTFNNKCLLRVEECATNRRFRIVHKGHCQSRPAKDVRQHHGGRNGAGRH